MTADLSSERKLDAQLVLSFLRDTANRPISLATLAKELELGDADQPEIKSILDELAKTGAVVQTREHYGVPEKMNLVVGTLSAHADGFGFVVPDRGSGGVDLFVTGRKLAGAMHGDRVVARMEHERRSGRREGRVIRVLKRARTHLVGKIESRGQGAYVTPLDSRIAYDVQVPREDLGGAKDGQIVDVEVTSYPHGNRGAEGKVLGILGDAGDARIDVDIVMREYDLPQEFPAAVLAEAADAPTEVTAEQIDGRTDFRALPIVTIDGATAQDFDDAVYVETLPNGDYRLHVHIADVAFYVPSGSAMDLEARERATSVYFPGTVVPMLPESLSNEICSLKPQVDRLVQSAVIDIDRQGKTVNFEFHDGVIHSAARLTYNEVAGVLDGDEALCEQYSTHRRQLESMKDLAQVLMEYRRQRGSIDFDLPEPELIINLRGETEDIIRSERNVAHRIIEEFMIRANEIVASHMTWEDVAALYRVHDGPNPERIAQFREFIGGLGHSLAGGSDVQPRHLMELIERLEGRPEERVIAMLMLRTMKQARYQVNNEGHFGLASQRYTHFTSPIRRYPDMVIHRLLKADRQSTQVAPFDVAELQAELDAIATTCSVNERTAEAAERKYTSWKKVQFMADKVGEVYEGHITGVRSFGMFVELEPLFVEGLVPVSALNDDYYRFDEPKHALRGENSGRTFTLGDRVKVLVSKVDLDRHRMDFALQEGPLEKPALPVEKKTRRRRRGGRRTGRTQGDAVEAPPLAASAVDAKAPETGGSPVAAPESVAGESGAAADAERSGRRRRRGRRGGRKRSTVSATGESSEAPQAGAEGQPEAAATGTKERSRRRQPQRDRDSAPKQEDREAKPDSGDGRKSEPSSRSGRQSRRGGRQDRRPNGRGRGARPAVEVKAAPLRQPQREKGPEKESKGPKVNPYLTDIDF